jgi:mRNA interferase MazF
VWGEHPATPSRQRFDELISPADPDFSSSGLIEESLIRLGFLVVVPQTSIVGSIGSISSERHKRLLQRLADHILTDRLPVQLKRR